MEYGEKSKIESLPTVKLCTRENLWHAYSKRRNPP